LPEVPAIREFAPDYEAEAWLGIAAPKKTPIEIIDKLNKEIRIALGDPKFKARITELGAAAIVTSPAEFATLIGEDVEKWGKVIRTANIKADWAERECPPCRPSSFVQSTSSSNQPLSHPN
jgi:tripartite-type tricarboxylate transporter receptor subunit TctC